VDQPRRDRPQRGGAKPEAIGRTGHQVLREHVRPLDHRAEQRPVIRILDVELDALLALLSQTKQLD
jgi:hypothetical protein